MMQNITSVSYVDDDDDDADGRGRDGNFFG